MRDDILSREEDIRTWVAENQSKAYICKQLDCKHTTLNRYLEIMGIDYEGNQGGKGFTKNFTTYVSAERYADKPEGVSSFILKQKLLREELKQPKCEVCGQEDWQGKPLPFKLYHKDGDGNNNDLENLIIVCPNCYSQLMNKGD